MKMKVKDLMDNLKYYDDDADVVFEICDDIEVERWTEDRYGAKTVYVNEKLEPSFISDIHDTCNIELGVVKK